MAGPRIPDYRECRHSVQCGGSMSSLGSAAPKTGQMRGLGRMRGQWACYIYDEAECFRFQIEGSLCDGRARDLEQSRRTASSVIGSRSWSLTLGNLTLIEPLGRALLDRWSQEGVRIVANSPLLRSIVRSIAGERVRFRIGPQPSPAEAWEEYVDSAVIRIEHDLGHRRLVPRTRSEAPRGVPHELIRRYVEAVFVPGATLAQALRVATGFGQSECESCMVRVDDRHAYSVARETLIRSIPEFRHPRSRVAAPHGSSAIRRLTTITSFREKDGGVSIEMEAIGLACDVPERFGWLVEPFVRLVSRRSLSTSLRRIVSASSTAGTRIGDGSPLMSSSPVRP